MILRELNLGLVPSLVSSVPYTLPHSLSHTFAGITPFRVPPTNSSYDHSNVASLCASYSRNKKLVLSGIFWRTLVAFSLMTRAGDAPRLLRVHESY